MNQVQLTHAGPLGAASAPHVLVVEDDAVVRRLLRRTCHQAGLAVTDAESGEQAIELFQQMPGGFPIVITDGIMPGIDGYGLARFIEREAPATRVILISGYLHHFISRPDIPGNIEAFFDKPFRPDEILAKVYELLEVSS